MKELYLLCHAAIAADKITLQIKGERGKIEIPTTQIPQIRSGLWEAMQLLKLRAGKNDFDIDMTEKDFDELRELAEPILVEDYIKEAASKMQPHQFKKIILPEPTMIAPPELRAITIHAPYAYSICLGMKIEEYRSKPTQHRNWILIHSGQSKDSDDAFKGYGLNPDLALRGAIIGCAILTDCKGSNGDFAYCLSHARLFGIPMIGIRGQQSIFWGKSEKYPERNKPFDLAWTWINTSLK